jgi:hypothetical protein
VEKLSNGVCLTTVFGWVHEMIKRKRERELNKTFMTIPLW